jgi:hypothetical protein
MQLPKPFAANSTMNRSVQKRNAAIDCSVSLRLARIDLDWKAIALSQVPLGEVGGGTTFYVVLPGDSGPS